MEKKILLNNLYDCYKDLLTDKQQNYFEEYYFDNLSLSEISENYGISRNGVHNLLKDAEKKLLFYEEKLSMMKRKEKLFILIKDIDEKKKEAIEKLFN